MRSFISLLVALLPLIVSAEDRFPDILCQVKVLNASEVIYKQTLNVYRWEGFVRYQDTLLEIPQLGTVRVAFSADGGDGLGNYFFALAWLFRISDNKQVARLELKQFPKKTFQDFFSTYTYTLACARNKQ